MSRARTVSVTARLIYYTSSSTARITFELALAYQRGASLSILHNSTYASSMISSCFCYGPELHGQKCQESLHREGLDPNHGGPRRRQGKGDEIAHEHDQDPVPDPE